MNFIVISQNDTPSLTGDFAATFDEGTNYTIQASDWILMIQTMWLPILLLR